ncbi:MAG: TetR/AcrR family transcriptional regulator [Propioniciclava sp.]
MASNSGDRAGRTSHRRRLTTDQRRQELIGTAVELLGNEPGDAFSMDEVAKRSGVSRPLLYHYFASKQELIRAVVAHESAMLAYSINSARLPEALDAYLDYVDSHPHGYRLLHGGPLQADREVKTIVERTRTLIENAVIAHLGIEKPTELTRLAVRGWTGYVIAVCMEWEGSNSTHRDEIHDLFIQALPTPTNASSIKSQTAAATPNRNELRE